MRLELIQLYTSSSGWLGRGLILIHCWNKRNTWESFNHSSDPQFWYSYSIRNLLENLSSVQLGKPENDLPWPYEQNILHQCSSRFSNTSPSAHWHQLDCTWNWICQIDEMFDDPIGRKKPTIITEIKYTDSLYIKLPSKNVHKEAAACAKSLQACEVMHKLKFWKNCRNQHFTCRNHRFLFYFCVLLTAWTSKESTVRSYGSMWRLSKTCFKVIFLPFFSATILSGSVWYVCLINLSKCFWFMQAAAWIWVSTWNQNKVNCTPCPSTQTNFVNLLVSEAMMNTRHFLQQPWSFSILHQWISSACRVRDCHCNCSLWLKALGSLSYFQQHKSFWYFNHMKYLRSLQL